MQFSVYDIINKVNLIQDIIDDIVADKSIDDYTEDICDILQEYLDIIKSATVNI